MTKVSDKYIAGFLDADGSIGVNWRKLDRADTDPSRRRAYPVLSFSQHGKRKKVLDSIQESIGGAMYEFNGYPCLNLNGKHAFSILDRIKQHLVIKRHYCNVVMDMSFKEHDVKEGRARLKVERRIKSLPLPNFPPRKWLAGYFDGDGCFGVRGPKNRLGAQITMEIVSSEFDEEGIEIIHKAFGGSINHKRGLTFWTLTMPPSKAIQAVGYFARHLEAKNWQAQFILGCARMGHYRDGNSIRTVMKQLKEHPHRLSESDVAKMLEGVADLTLSESYLRAYAARKRQSNVFSSGTETTA